MSLMGTLARAEAMAGGRAVPVATVRHRHLSDRPLVFVPLTTAGEVGAPLGAMVGTAREEPALLVVPQPRDRDLRSAFLAELARVVLPYLESYADATEAPGTRPTARGGEETEVCADAPQLIVPSGAGVEYVRLLGRATRFRRTAEDDPEAPYPAPAGVPLLGRWLTHYGERARTPGASLLLAVTDLLARHWATGQSALEDQHLAALLAWIDPPDGMSGAEAARRAETGRGPDGLLLHPPAGPATDPVFDNTQLAPAIARYDAGLPGAEPAVRDLVAGQLRPVWDDVWHGLDLLRALPEGARVADRWKRDRWSYTGHRDRVRTGEPPQPRRDDAVTAAQKLAARETAQVRLEAQEALDDPLVMAARRLAGEAFAGEVVEVEMAYGGGKVPRPRPLVTVATDDRPLLEDDAKLYRALPGAAGRTREASGGAREASGGAGRTQEARFVAWAGPGRLTVRVVNGMGRGREPEPGSVPETGDRVCWTLFEHTPRGGPALPEPEDTPWTHGGPPGAAGPGAAGDTAAVRDATVRDATAVRGAAAVRDATFRGAAAVRGAMVRDAATAPGVAAPAVAAFGAPAAAEPADPMRTHGGPRGATAPGATGNAATFRDTTVPDTTARDATVRDTAVRGAPARNAATPNAAAAPAAAAPADAAPGAPAGAAAAPGAPAGAEPADPVSTHIEPPGAPAPNAVGNAAPTRNAAAWDAAAPEVAASGAPTAAEPADPVTTEDYL